MSTPARLLFVIDPFAAAGDLDQHRACELAAALAGRGHAVDLAAGDPGADCAAVRNLAAGTTYRALLLTGDPMSWSAWIAAALGSPEMAIIMRPAIDERWLVRWGSRPEARAKVPRLLRCAHRLVARRTDGPEALFFNEEGLAFICIDDDDQAAGTAADIYTTFFAAPETGREPDMAIAALDRRAHVYHLSFAQVQMLLDSGRLGEALSQLERMVANDPERAEGHNDLAVLYHSAGRLADADRAIRRASEIDPANDSIADNRTAITTALAAQIAPAAGARSGAKTFATVAPPAVKAATPPPPASGYRDSLRAAETLIAAGKLDAAVAELERFVEREPAHGEAWNDLGVMQHGAGKLDAARAALTVALTIDARSAQPRRNLAGVLLELGRTDEAAAALEPLLAANPNDAGALALAGDISVAIRQPNDARAFYRSALASDPANGEIAAKLATLEPASSTPAVPAGPRVLEYDPATRQAPPDAAFDVVRCRTPLDRIPDPVGALKEMARALKPGGKMWFDVGCPLEATKHAQAATTTATTTLTTTATAAAAGVSVIAVSNGASPRSITVV